MQKQRLKRSSTILISNLKNKIMKKLFLTFTTIALLLSCVSPGDSMEIVQKKYPKFDVVKCTNYTFLVNDTSSHTIRYVECLNITNNDISSDYRIIRYK